jgi:tellurite resistance protein
MIAAGRMGGTVRSYPCLIVDMPDEIGATHLHEGDEITLQRQPDAVACFHDGHCVGYIPRHRQWVSRSIDDGDRHKVTVTGFDMNDAGDLAAIEIEIAVLSEGQSRAEPPVIRSILSEIGDELRILAMVGAVDGTFAKPERAFLEKFAELRGIEKGVEPEEGEVAHAVRWARRNACSSLDAAEIIAKLAREGPETLQVMWDMCEIMAEIDGEVKEAERQAVIGLRGLLEHGMRLAKESKD